MRQLFVITMAILIVAGFESKSESDNSAKTENKTPRILEGEKHFANIKQITFGGQNAEAYWSSDGSELIFQSQRDSAECDVIYRMNADGTNVRMISSGKGVTTCSFISPDGTHLLYASTHLDGETCPPRPDMSLGYTWPLYDSYDIFRADPDGGHVVRLTDTPGYDAEAVYAPDGSRIIFTSVRDGDLDLYTMEPDGSNVKRLTNEIGYDGGAFFSRDSKWICWRASRPSGDNLTDYLTLLQAGLIRPRQLEIYVMDLEQMEPIQLTNNQAANFGPYFHPDGQRVIFCSNLHDPKGRNFDLFMVDIETKEIEQITHNQTFDGFPMFSYDGSKLVFASNRNNKVKGETNIFTVDWVD